VGQDVELILLKQLASCLRIPIALLGPDGAVLYFNEPAEAVFGLRFEEVGGMDPDEWQSLLQPSDAFHVPLKREARPLMTALDQRIPSHGRVHLRTSSEEWSEVEVTGVPLVALGERFLGALSLFWRPGTRMTVAPPDGAAPDDPHAVELILTRRLASTLVAPVFLVDAWGRLLYFNPAAETIVGRPLPEAQRVDVHRDLYESFQPRDEEGAPIAPEDHPMVVARTRCEPIHRLTWIRGLDGQDRRIAITALPLVGQSDRLVGAFGLFWETRP
jgi:PAS domain-containing protein